MSPLGDGHDVGDLEVLAAVRALLQPRRAAAEVAAVVAHVYHGGAVRHQQDQSDAGGAGIFSRSTNQTQEARVFSHGGPIRRRRRAYVLNQTQKVRVDAGSAGMLSRRTNQTQ
eukprot:3469931-Pyramimonas_sp.AAC.2